MRDFVKFLPSFWISAQGKQIKNLGAHAQIVSVYLLTCPNSTMLGIYYLPIPLITHETGVPFEDAQKTLQSLEDIDFCSYDITKEYVWVHDMGFSQIDKQLKVNDNRIKYVNDIVNKLPELDFFSRFIEKYREAFLLQNSEGMGGSLEALKSKYKNKKKEKNKKQHTEGDIDQPYLGAF